MKHRILFGLAIALLSIARTFADDVVLSDPGTSLTLPSGWERVAEQRPGILLSAQSDGGQLRFMFTKPPTAADAVKTQDAVQNPEFQQGVRKSLNDQGFSKIVRAEVVQIAGSTAFLCEATKEDGSQSVMQIVWLYNDSYYSLVFLSLSKPFKDVPDVQKIIDSIKASKQ